MQLLPSSTPCFSFCKVSGIGLYLGLLHYIQSLPVTEISEEKTRIGSFWHFFREHLCYICYLQVKCNDSFYWIVSFPLSAEWFYLAQCKRYVLILPALFRLRGGRGFCARNLTSLGPSFPCAVAALPYRWVTQVWALFRARISKEANAAQSLEVFWALHCHQYSCALWQHFTADLALRHSKPFPEATGVGIVFQGLKPAVQMGLRFKHLNESHDRMCVTTGCQTCFWGKHYTCSAVCISCVLGGQDLVGWKCELGRLRAGNWSLQNL